MSSALTGPAVFVDGECNVCDRTVRFLLDHDRHGTLQVGSLQGAAARDLAATVPGFPVAMETVVVAEPDAAAPTGVRLHLRSDALVRAMELAGIAPRLAAVLRWVPRPVRDVAYRAFVPLRHRLGGRKDECRLPTAEERGRLLP